MDLNLGILNINSKLSRLWIILIVFWQFWGLLTQCNIFWIEWCDYIYDKRNWKETEKWPWIERQTQFLPCFCFLAFAKILWNSSFSISLFHSFILVWPQWWSFEDKSQLEIHIYLYSKNQFKTNTFWFDFDCLSKALSKVKERFKWFLAWKLTLKIRCRHFLTIHLKLTESQIKNKFLQNKYLSKHLFTVDPCPQNSSPEVMLSYFYHTSLLQNMKIK